MVGVGETVEQGALARGTPSWIVVLGQELRDLWLGGRGLALCFAFSILLSVIAYLVATSTDFNFLEQRESASLMLQVAVAAGGLLALLASADAVSGERERGTLETLLLTPVSRLESSSVRSRSGSPRSRSPFRTFGSSDATSGSSTTRSWWASSSELSSPSSSSRSAWW